MFARFLQTGPPGSHRPRQRRRSGASLVEFALVAPILFLLLLGIFEFARAFMVTELLKEAARKAARVATLEGATSSQIKAAATDFLTAAGVQSENVGVSVNGAPADSVDPATSPMYTDMTVTVTVPAAKVSWVPTPLFTGSANLSGQFSMRRE